MASAVLMPKAGITVESCVITEWLKKPGDTVAMGEILFRYETDKASFACESTEAGTILELFYETGDEVVCLTPVCAVGRAGDDASALRPDGSSAAAEPAKAEEPAPSRAAVPVAPAVVAAASAGKISPRAKNLAVKHHVPDANLAGTGPSGRVIERDVRAAIDAGFAATGAAYTEAAPVGAGTAVGGRTGVGDLAFSGTSVFVAELGPDGAARLAPDFEDVPFSGIRRVISSSMTASLATIPQLTHNHRFDAGDILALREKFKQNGAALGLPNITLGDMVMFAVSRLLPQYPALNAHMLDPFTVRRFREVNLGFACDTERGLMVPVVHSANRKSLAQISAEVKALAVQAQSGALSPDAMTGGTFTISNLGAFGVESFTPVINPPQTGILGVNGLKTEVRVRDGAIEAFQSMGLSLTYDHRAIDGAPAARFAKELCGMLESFSLMLSM